MNRKTIFAALLFMTTGIVGAETQLNAILPLERKTAPDFSAMTLDGKAISLREFGGKPYILHFWATWCVPCRDELPTLQRIAMELAGKANVLSVSADGKNIKAVNRIKESASIRFPIIMDPHGTIRRMYEIDSLPVTYLVGADGRFIAKIVGSREWDNPRIRAALLHLLGLHEMKR